MGVTVTDTNNVPKYLKIFKQLSKKKLEIGVFGSDVSGSEPNILMIAAVNEYGIDIKVTDKMRGYLHYQGIHLKKSTTEIRIPERSYLRDTFDKKLKKMEKVIQKLFLDVIDLKITVDLFYQLVGTQIVTLVQDYMTDLRDPPNTPITIAKKGSSNPLIDTGELRSKITYKVV